MVVAVIIRDHDRRVVTSFVKGLTNALWKVETMDISYDDIGDSVSDSCTILTAVHSACCRAASPLQLKAPPVVQPKPIGAFLWEPFDRDDHSLCLSRDDTSFNKDDNNKMIVTTPKQANASSSRKIRIKYHCIVPAWMHPSSLVHLCFLTIAFVRHSNHVPTRTFSSNTSALNFITRIRRMSARFPLSSSLGVLVSPNRYNIVSHTNGTAMALTQLCRVGL